MAKPSKVYSSSGCAFRQPSGYHKILSDSKSCHPATYRNRAPGACLYRNHRHNVFQLPRPRKWASAKGKRGIVHRRKQFYERGKEPDRMCGDFPDLSHRGTKPTPRDFSPKGRADCPHLSLRACGREDSKCLHKFPVCICHLTHAHTHTHTHTHKHTRGYLEGKRSAYCREQTGETWLKNTEALRSCTASKKRW